MTTIYGGLKIGEETMQRAAGCGLCTMGYAPGTPPPPLNMPVYLGRMSQFRDGAIHFCDCSAGEMARRGLENLAVREQQNDLDSKIAIERSREARLSRLFADARIPDKFAALTTAGYVTLAGKDTGKRAAINAVKEHYRAGSVIGMDGAQRFGLYLYGKTDMGKTGLLCPLFMHYVKAGESGLWMQYNDMLAAVRDWNSGKVEERIEAMQRTSYLFIDDWGDPLSEKVATDYAREVMHRIIDYRNNYRKPTFITSNLAPSKLAAQFHDRLGKRLAELCAVIEVTGAPMRELMHPDKWAVAT